MQLSNVPGVVMTLVLIGLILGAGTLALSKFSSSLTASSAEQLVVGNVTSGLGNLATQLPTVGTINYY